MASYKIDMIKEVFDLARYISSSQPDGRLTLIQLRTVMFVAEHGTVKPTEIAKNFAITPASVTSQIDNLVKEGWLERRYNQDDKRVIEVTITDRGKKELPKEIEKLEENCGWLFNTVSTEEAKQITMLVKKANKTAIN
jgi:DNA-binding MarR family transcriptional regulator